MFFCLNFEYKQHTAQQQQPYGYPTLATNTTVAPEQSSSKVMLDRSQCCTAPCIAPILLVVLRSDSADSLSLFTGSLRAKQRYAEGPGLVQGSCSLKQEYFAVEKTQNLSPEFRPPIPWFRKKRFFFSC